MALPHSRDSKRLYPPARRRCSQWEFDFRDCQRLDDPTGRALQTALGDHGSISAERWRKRARRFDRSSLFYFEWRNGLALKYE